METIPVSIEDLQGHSIVIDGANLLHESTSKKKSLELEPLKEFVEELQNSGLDSVNIVFDASTQHKFKDKNEAAKFRELINGNRNHFTMAPKSTEADSIILNIAYKTNSLVITNDFYDDYKEKITKAMAGSNIIILPSHMLWVYGP